MLWGKKLLRVAAALGVAFAAAHTAESLKGPVVHQPLLASTASLPPQPPAADAAVRRSAVPDSASLSTPADSGLGDLVGITTVAASAPPAGSEQCEPQLALAPLPGAMIQAQLTAPCNRNERIVVRHSGLAFSAVTRADGTAAVMLPALKTEAMVAVYLEDAQLVLGQVTVADAAAYARYAIVWDSPIELELRVTDGDKVLVGSLSPAEGSEPRVMALGHDRAADPVLARVYSVPGSDLGDADITGELRITPATCGQTLRVETLYATGGEVEQAEQSVTVPLCGTAGDILVLKNLAPAMKLAAPK